MRYTTLLDISEIRQIYRSPTCCRLYLHMTLKAGYHDDDRDIYDASVRETMAQTGLTMGEVRHGIRMLLKHGLITKSGPVYIVRKWLPEQHITSRQAQATAARAAAIAQQRIADQRAMEDRRARDEQQEAERRAAGTNSFIAYYESLIKRWQQSGDDADLQTLHRRHAMYLNECQQMHHEPISIN